MHGYSVNPTNDATQRELSHYRTNSCQFSDLSMTTTVASRQFSVTGVANIHLAALRVQNQRYIC